jgi:hypothetical protein
VRFSAFRRGCPGSERGSEGVLWDPREPPWVSSPWRALARQRRPAALAVDARDEAGGAWGRKGTLLYSRAYSSSYNSPFK